MRDCHLIFGDRAFRLLEVKDFEDSISFGTGDPKKVHLRFSAVAQLIRGTLNASVDRLTNFKCFEHQDIDLQCGCGFVSQRMATGSQVSHANSSAD